MRFARAFTDLQQLRHSADYDHQSAFSPTDATSATALAGEAIADLGAATSSARGALVALVLTG